MKTLVENLKEQRIIDKTVFAFHLSDFSNSQLPNSSLSIGSWNLGKYALDKEFTYLHLYDKSGYWAVRMYGFSLNQEASEIAESNVAEIDSYTSFLYLPKEAFDLYRSAVCPLVSCDISKSYIEFNCENGEEERWPDLTFTLGGFKLPISPKHYILKTGNICEDLVNNFSQDFYRFGMPFMRAYYTLFDMENFRIGVARSINYPYPSIWNMTTLLIISLALLAAIVVGIGYYHCRRKNDPESVENSPSINSFEPLLHLYEEY